MFNTAFSGGLGAFGFVCLFVCLFYFVLFFVVLIFDLFFHSEDSLPMSPRYLL